MRSRKKGYYLEIAELIEVRKSTAGRELKRNRERRGYCPQQAPVFKLHIQGYDCYAVLSGGVWMQSVSKRMKGRTRNCKNTLRDYFELYEQDAIEKLKEINCDPISTIVAGDLWHT